MGVTERDGLECQDGGQVIGLGEPAIVVLISEFIDDVVAAIARLKAPEKKQSNEEQRHSQFDGHSSPASLKAG